MKQAKVLGKAISQQEKNAHDERGSDISDEQDHKRIIVAHMALLITAQATRLHEFIKDMEAIAKIRDTKNMHGSQLMSSFAALGLGQDDSRPMDPQLADMIHDRENLPDMFINSTVLTAQNGLDFYETLLWGMRHIISSDNINSPEHLVEGLTQKAISCRLDRLDFQASSIFNHLNASSDLNFNRFVEWCEAYTVSDQCSSEMRNGLDGLSYVIGESDSDELSALAGALSPSIVNSATVYGQMTHVIGNLVDTTKDIMLQDAQTNMNPVHLAFQKAGLGMVCKATHDLLNDIPHAQTSQISTDTPVYQEWFDIFMRDIIAPLSAQEAISRPSKSGAMAKDPCKALLQ